MKPKSHTLRKMALAIIPALCLLSGCSQKEFSFDYAGHLGNLTPCIVEQDTTVVILRDYFPKMNDMDTLTIITSAEAPFLVMYECYDTVDGVEKFCPLLVKNAIPAKLEGVDKSKAPKMSTLPAGSSGKDFFIRIEGGMEQLVILWEGRILERGRHFDLLSDSLVRVRAPRAARKVERSHIQAFTANASGVGNDILIPLEFGKVIRDPKQLKRTDKHSQILYSLLIDRFVNGNIDNDWSIGDPSLVHPKVDYWGGDLAGVTAKIKDGYFRDLGINTIWLSPITQNPYDAWGYAPDPGTKFSGYHGYWPIFATRIDDRFGTDEELNELLAEAHAADMNVILDYVSNHMHIESPTLKAHPDWTTPSYTPDGRKNRELWDEFRLTTWFDDHIPSFDLEREEICRQLSDTALFWMQNYDFDGYRHDATKHIPEGYWRLLTRKLLDSLPGKSLYQIGETYGSLSLISLYVKPGMLDGQFDFNVYDTYIWATTRPEGSFEGLAGCIDANLGVYGHHNLMGYISGNHDRPRYVCLASGDVKHDEDQKLAGWKRDIVVSDTMAYRKLAMLHALNLTLPGVPCIYYGDEYGQPGANDPDNRRWMEFEGYSSYEQQVADAVKEFTHLRRSSMPLMYGDYFRLAAENDVFAYMRSYMGEAVITFLNKSADSREISVSLPFGLEYNGSSTVSVTLEPYSYLIIETNK